MTDGLEPVAVIGAACRFPGAGDLAAYWANLRAGTESIVVLSDADLIAAGVPAGELADRSYVKAAAPLGDPVSLDPALFGEGADAGDGTARLFCEVAHAAIEDAGYDVTAVGELTGVFGAGHSDLAGFAASRLGTSGPAFTFLSDSLAAVHLAAQAVRAGDCTMAVAGGAQLATAFEHGYRWDPSSPRPSDGHSRPFDASASGCVPGSGAGAVVLKPLREALLDGDHIRAVICSDASGHGTQGARRAVVEAMELAGLAREDLAYLEAHGAGTVPGDAAELTGLARAYEELGGTAEPIPIGSVKSNIGDLGAAAGIAGLLKLVLALDHDELPETINLGAPNPVFHSPTHATAPFRPARTAVPWPEGRPRRAATQSVDSGGTTTHLIVEAGPRPQLTPHGERQRVVVWSARTPAAAKAARTALAAHFAEAGEERFADTVATLQQGRTAHPVRGAVVCASAAEAAERLVRSDVKERMAVSGREVVFAFGGRRALKAVSLYGTHRVFTETMDLCLEAFENAGLDLYDTLLSGGDDAALRFAVDYALAAAWTDWGVQPVAAAGAGIGQVAAITVAGMIDLGDAVRLLTGTAPAKLAWGRPRFPVHGPDGQRLTGPGSLDRPSWDAPAAAPSTGLHQEDRIVLDVGRHDDETGLMQELARLWTHGVTVDWPRIDVGHPLQRLPVPVYPYQRVEADTIDTTVKIVEPAAPPVAAAPPAPAVADGLPEPAEPLAPLGRVQHAFWVLEELAPGTGVSNLCIAFRTARPLRWWPLQMAVKGLLRRHPALRLRFPEVNGVPVQHLTAPEDADMSLETQASTEETLVADLQHLLDAPFDLRREFPFRLGHLTLPDGTSVVSLVAHHIVVDGTSLQILVEDLSHMYDGLTERGAIPAELQAEAPLLAEAEPSEESVAHWVDHLDGVEPEAMALPIARPAPARPTFAGNTRTLEMGGEAQEAMRALRRELRTTDNIVLMSAFCLSLARHGAGPDLVFGVPIDTRRPATARHVGYGVTTLPLRVRVDPDLSFRALTARVAEAFFSGLEHADAGAETVITTRGHGTSDWRVPLFRHMFNHRPWNDERIRFGGQAPEYIKDIFDRSRLDLQFVAVPKPGEFLLRASYSTEVHDEADMVAFLRRFQALLEGAAEDPDRPVGELGFSAPADQALLDDTNRTAADWTGPPTLLERIASPADLDATAVVEGERSLTYRELLHGANAIRDLLRANGVREGDTVGLALGRSAAMAAAVLGVWAAGAAYLPLDADQPDLRLAYQVEDAEARLILAPEDTLEWAGTRTVLRLSGVPEGVPGPLLDTAPPDPAAPAYVIYTSGSTGRPKGVAVSHGNLANLVLDFATRLDPAAVLWSTTTAFDISALELYLPLLRGGRLVVAPDEAQLRPRVFLDLIRAEDVTVVQATPTAWRMVVGEVEGELAGRTVLCGGEPMPAALARRLLECGCRLLNVYGPTETTIWSTVAEITEAPADPVPIGRPLANTQVFIAGADGAEQPPGLPGELCVAGDGVAIGYPKLPEMTAQRFGEHPRYGRFYRTGDLALVRHDGALEMLGRDDRQVKLRGHRIELGEVEAVLHEHDRVTLAAVALFGDPQSDGRLVAFVQSPGQGDGLDEELWRHARDRLPAYAVPSGIHVVDSIPTTPNGKIAYNELAAVLPRRDGPVFAPSDGDPELTSLLAGLWRETLDRPGLGEHDNFFLNGGHSILAVRLVTRIEELAGRPVDVRAVFEHPTPAELAAHLGEAP